MDWTPKTVQLKIESSCTCTSTSSLFMNATQWLSPKTTYMKSLTNVDTTVDQSHNVLDGVPSQVSTWLLIQWSTDLWLWHLHHLNFHRFVFHHRTKVTLEFKNPAFFTVA